MEPGVRGPSAAPEPPTPERLEAAQRVARAARRGLPQLEGPHRTSRENESFVPEFFRASRLHFIGSWKNRYQLLLDSLPPPPPLPPTPPDGQRVLAHIDMDCFFASVAARNRPELEGLPVAVAWSDSEKGHAEIASCNYVARAYGLRNGMWVARARELCSCLVVMPYEFESYTVAADKMYRAVFAVTPHVMGVSVDECYADLTHVPEPEAALAGLRTTIREQTGCNASIGVGPNRLLARIATKRAKPDGLVRLSLGEARAMLREMPVGELPGLGRDKAAKLDAIGVATCGDLLDVDAGRCRDALGVKVAATFRAFADGVDKREWEPRPPRKSVGAQSSWGVRFATDAEAHKFVDALCGEVSKRLSAQGLRGAQITLKVWRAMEGAPSWMQKGSMGHGMCDHLSRSITLPSATSDADKISGEANKMLVELRIPATALRGIGVSVGRLGGDSGGGGGGGGGGGIGSLFGAAASSSRSLPARIARAPPPSTYSPDKVPAWWRSVTHTAMAAKLEEPARPSAEGTSPPQKRTRADGTTPAIAVAASMPSAVTPAPSAASTSTMEQVPTPALASGSMSAPPPVPTPPPASLRPTTTTDTLTRMDLATDAWPVEAEGGLVSSQEAFDELLPYLDAMKDAVRIAYARAIAPDTLPPPEGGGGDDVGSGGTRGSLLSLMAEQLLHEGSGSPVAAKDAIAALIRFARDLSTGSFLAAAEHGAGGVVVPDAARTNRINDWVRHVESINDDVKTAVARWESRCSVLHGRR